MEKTLQLQSLSMEDNERDTRYMELHGIRAIFERLTKGLILQQPEQVHDFLIEDLKRIASEKLGALHVVFITGGPGSGCTAACQMLAEEFGFEHINVDEMLKGVESGGIDKLNSHLDTLKDGTVVLLDGFPNTIAKALRFEIQVMPCRFLVHFEGAGGDEATLKAYEAASRPVTLYFSAVERLVTIPASAQGDEMYQAVRAPFVKMLEESSK